MDLRGLTRRRPIDEPFYPIDFQKNHFILPCPSPQIPFLLGARVRLNTEPVLAFIASGVIEKSWTSLYSLLAFLK
jgi:hypothetical protein